MATKKIAGKKAPAKKAEAKKAEKAVKPWVGYGIAYDGALSVNYRNEPFLVALRADALAEAVPAAGEKAVKVRVEVIP